MEKQGTLHTTTGFFAQKPISRHFCHSKWRLMRIVTWLASLDRKLWGDVYLTVKPHARFPLFFQRKYNYVHDIIKYILHCMTNALVYAWIIIIIITIWCTTISERSKRYRIIKWIYIYIYRTRACRQLSSYLIAMHFKEFKFHSNKNENDENYFFNFHRFIKPVRKMLYENFDKRS
jgi:hypothetical protein